MVTRTDVTVDYNPSPRIAEVASPSDEFVMQDVVDTLHVDEFTFTGMTHSKLLSASGKESLGGGVLVGITVALQDTLIAFEARTSPAETGTVTTGSSPATGSPLTYNFIDTTALFQTNSVARGSLCINFTDQSIADVVEVISETELRTRVLVNGSDNEWDVSDSYQIFNIVQVRAVGGNLTAVDSAGSPLSSGVLPTAFTQVLVTASSSATLQELEDIQFSSFSGTHGAGVYIDTSNSSGNAQTGTDFPAGTQRQPSLIISEAHQILTELGVITFYILGNVTVGAGTHPHVWVGQSQVRTTITLNAGANLIDAEFTQATIQGTLDSNTFVNNCHILNLTMFDGAIHESLFEGTITLGNGMTATFIDCWGGSPSTTPTIDIGGSGQELLVQNYSGEITLINKTGTDDCNIGLLSGDVTIDPTCTAGTIHVHGVGHVTDNSGPGCTIEDELLSADKLTELWQDKGFDVDNPVTIDESARTISVAGTVRTWVGNVIKTLTRTT